MTPQEIRRQQEQRELVRASLMAGDCKRYNVTPLRRCVSCGHRHGRCVPCESRPEGKAA